MVSISRPAKAQQNIMVSTIITSFNQKEFIAQAIQSVISQTYQHWECIVVDDGSTDGSAELIERLINNDKRCKLLRQENRGVAEARNAGFATSCGSFIQFLDGDDFLGRQKFEIQVDFLNVNSSIDVCYTNHCYYLEDKKITTQYQFKRLKGNPLHEVLYEYDNGVSIPIHSGLFRRNIWQEAELPFSSDYRGRYEDWVFWVRLALKGIEINFLNYNMAFYRMHGKNFCSNRQEVLTNSIAAAEYITTLAGINEKDKFYEHKKAFFLQRFETDSKKHSFVNGARKQFKRARNKIGSLKRNIEIKIQNYKEGRFIKQLRHRLINREFSIISNNCWGGGVYEDLGLRYLTPTIGLFFFPGCYIEFVSGLKNYLSLPLTFIDKSKYEKANELRKEFPYPIGILGGLVEIHFLHYKTKSDAIEKWNRRKERVNFQNLFISFSDNEGYTLDQLQTFEKLPYNKVFFTSKPSESTESRVVLTRFADKPTVGDIYSDKWSYRIEFDVINWLNSDSKC